MLVNKNFLSCSSGTSTPNYCFHLFTLKCNKNLIVWSRLDAYRELHALCLPYTVSSVKLKHDHQVERKSETSN